MRSSSATTTCASSTSCCSTPPRARSNAVLTRSSPPSALASRLASSSRYSVRAAAGIFLSLHLAEPAADVVLGLLLARVGEDLLGRPHLDQVPRLAGRIEVEEGGDVAGPRRLLHVVSDDDDRVAALQLADQVLDGEGRDRVECRAGLVHQQDLGLDRDRAGD